MSVWHPTSTLGVDVEDLLRETVLRKRASLRSVEFLKELEYWEARVSEEAGLCPRCFGYEWVCEKHPDMPWSGVTDVFGCEPGCVGPGTECDLCWPITSKRRK